MPVGTKRHFFPSPSSAPFCLKWRNAVRLEASSAASPPPVILMLLSSPVAFFRPLSNLTCAVSSCLVVNQSRTQQQPDRTTWRPRIHLSHYQSEFLKRRPHSVAPRPVLSLFFFQVVCARSVSSPISQRCPILPEHWITKPLEAAPVGVPGIHCGDGKSSLKWVADCSKIQ